MPSMVRICLGTSIIVITFIVGMIMMVNSIMSLTFDFGLIMFYTLGLPLIGCLIAIPILCTGVQSDVRASQAGTTPIRSYPPATQSQPFSAASYVYEPPTTCPDCKGRLTSTNVDWVGPLTLKCPYCGSTIQAVKRLV